eukprot:2604530-Pyramimonas_sp.AAC.2
MLTSQLELRSTADLRELGHGSGRETAKDEHAAGMEVTCVRGRIAARERVTRFTVRWCSVVMARVASARGALIRLRPTSKTQHPIYCPC